MTKIDLSKITTFLFDFDGVIADSEQNRYDYFARRLKELGIELSQICQVQDQVGLTSQAFFDKFLPDLDPALTTQIIADRRQAAKEDFFATYRVLPGVIETLKKLTGSGYQLALVTANPQARAEKMLEIIGIRDYFAAVFGQESCWNDELREKDYSLVPGQLGRKPEECLVIEDSRSGIAGAKKAGLKCIAFGQYLTPELIDLADAAVNCYEQFQQLLWGKD